jgi:UDP-N-acetyl-D-galactosamine dehydrogenase
MHFRPGLVGGHCIGIDPYYLVERSILAGYIPDIIRQAREINDGMARNVSNRLVKALIMRDMQVKKATVLIVGFTFKENCSDIRNTKVIDLIHQLIEFDMQVDVVDTWANPADVEHEYDIKISTTLPTKGNYQVVILAVAHTDIISKGIQVLRNLSPKGIIFDMKAGFSIEESDIRL